ncbi:hypothetical protein KSD_62530 [Ktedonobacter sp. SOSP1-85]|uniref:homoserine kinase n=1 Tax=Ktedonobacter sp. SOSP1-85 TaxID=2778367 RepID=UPI00191625CD|nr:homoserine kinase [Ktedonobacter sp. SOSP1-85]GHO78482.1 hypothetical protein KSD_62530 [Ktedonobacter sp. SOSP1-85]
MAAKTHFSEQALKDILSRYTLGELLAFESVTTGTVQTNYFLQTTQGRFVFRYYQNRSLESVLFESELIRYLTRCNYPCPAVLQDRNGEHAGIYNEKPYAIFEFATGQHLEHPNEAQKRQLVQQVAELNTITRDYKPLHTPYRLNYNVETCWELAQEATQRINTAQAREKLAWLEHTLAGLHLPPSLPRGVCHCDFHFSNLLFTDGKFSALIDFDDANYTFLLYDLAALINPFQASFDWNTWHRFQKEENVFDFNETRTILQEYTRHRALSMDEKRHLFDVYKLSILFDCIWYFERWEGEDFYERRKIGYLDRLGRDQFYAQIFAG